MRKHSIYFFFILAIFVFSLCESTLALEVTVSPREIFPGDAFVLKVTDTNAKVLKLSPVSFNERKFYFSRYGKECFLAVGVVGIDVKSGYYTLKFKIGKKRKNIKVVDPAAFQWFLGIGPELTPGLERELATFLDDAGIAVVRAEVKRAHEKQMTDMVDMQIGMMAIRDLSDDQKTRMREVFVGKDVMTEQFTRFGEIVRDRDRFRRLMKGEGIRDEMEKGFQGTRQRVRGILNDEQFAKYEVYEQQLVRQAEMGLKMMSSLLGTPREGTKAPASR